MLTRLRWPPLRPLLSGSPTGECSHLFNPSDCTSWSRCIFTASFGTSPDNRSSAMYSRAWRGVSDSIKMSSCGMKLAICLKTFGDAGASLIVTLPDTLPAARHAKMLSSVV